MVNAKVENASAVPVSLEKIAVRNIVQQIVTEKVFVKTGPVNVLMDMKEKDVKELPVLMIVLVMVSA